MSLKKIYLPILSFCYGIYNFFAISILIYLFIAQKTWNPSGNIRRIKKTI